MVSILLGILLLPIVAWSFVLLPEIIPGVTLPLLVPAGVWTAFDLAFSYAYAFNEIFPIDTVFTLAFMALSLQLAKFIFSLMIGAAKFIKR